MYSFLTSFTCSAVFSSHVTCTIPERSLRSMNTSEPRFLLFAVHQISVTFLPASAARRVPFPHVLSISFTFPFPDLSDQLIKSSSNLDFIRGALDIHRSVFQFILTDNHNKFRLASVRALELRLQ